MVDSDDSEDLNYLSQIATKYFQNSWLFYAEVICLAFLCIAVFQKPCRKYPHVPYQTNGWSVSYEEAIGSLMLPSFHKWIVP